MHFIRHRRAVVLKCKSISISKSTIDNAVFLALSAFLFLLAKPYFSWGNGIGVICLLVWFAYNVANIRRLDVFKVFFYLFACILFIWNTIISDPTFSKLILALIIPSFLFLDKSLKAKVLDHFVRFYTFIMVISIVVYGIVLTGAFALPVEIISPLSPYKGHDYFRYPFLVMPTSVSENILPRFCGPFDEPGVVGTISGIILATYRRSLNKVSYIIILISGILSFSFFFFGIYLLSSITLSIKNILVIIAIIAAAFVIFIDDETYDRYIKSRLEVGSDGTLKADNRVSSKFEHEYEAFWSTSDLFFGSDNFQVTIGGSSYKIFIFLKGAVLFVLVVSFFLIYAKLYLGSYISYYIFFLVFFGMTYQRPYYFEPFYFFLFLACVDKLAQLEPSKARRFVSY